MTACVNKKSKRVAAVVTASLVGALSIGAPAVALATGTTNIDMLAVDWFTDAKVSKATDGQGGVVADPTKATFTIKEGKSQYLVPTEVKNSAYTTDVTTDDFTITYTATKKGNGLDGIADGIEYKSDELGVKQFTYYASKGMTADQAEAYFSGKLEKVSGVAKGIVKPIADSYTVTISADGAAPITQVFVLKDASATYDVHAYVGDDKSATSIVFTGNGQTINFADADNQPVSPQSLTITKIGGSTVANGSVKDAGDYVASFTLSSTGTKKYNVPFTVAKVDLSKASFSVEDGTSISNPLASIMVNGIDSNLAGDVTVTSIKSPNGAVDYTDKGAYTVEFAANSNSSNVTGSGSVSFYVLDTDLFATGGYSVYYGSNPITGDELKINLAEGETFDPSKVKVVKGESDPVYKGDQIEVVVTDSEGNVVENGAITEKGDYTLSVRVKPVESGWPEVKLVGGSKSDITIKVSSTKLDANKVLAFYLDGEIAGNADSVTYDGTDALKRLTVSIKDEEGNAYEQGKDFTLEVKSGNKVVTEAVNAGDYKVVVKPLTFSWTEGSKSGADFDLTVDKMDLTQLVAQFVDVKSPAADNGLISDTYTYTDAENHEQTAANEFYVPYTGKAVAVPAVTYQVKSGDTYSYPVLDSSLYKVANIKFGGKVVSEAKAKGTYTVRIALTDEAAKNYTLSDSDFTFTIRSFGHFADVDSAEWYSVAVEKAYNLKYIKGISGTNLFAPKADITRADAVCILFNMAGGEFTAMGEFQYNETTGWITGFNDVDGKAYFAEALAWANAADVANGSNGQFRPYDKITREEFASLLANFAKTKGDFEDVDADEVLGSATDYSAWAKENVAWAKANKIMGNGGFINGTGNITRAEVAAMAVNYQPEAL